MKSRSSKIVGLDKLTYEGRKSGLNPAMLV
jgi:hypothetical protein